MSAPAVLIWDVTSRLHDTAAGDQLAALIQLAALRQDIADTVKRFFATGGHAFRVAPFDVEVRPADRAIIVHFIQFLCEELSALLAAGRADIGHSGHDGSPSDDGAPEGRAPP